MHISDEEKELCEKIRETGTAKLAERLDRLSKIVGVPWNDGNDPQWMCHVYYVTRDLRSAVYDRFFDVYSRQAEGRQTFRERGVQVTNFNKDYAAGKYTATLWLGDKEARPVPIQGTRGPYGEGRVDEPSMEWWYSHALSAPETMEKLAATLKYIDDLIDFCLRCQVAKGELDGIEVDECHERIRKARHQLELLEKL